ncbi:MAG: hypothetical protein NXI24_01865 [bacterium]|nr:hypothetical protein [bacterium]
MISKLRIFRLAFTIAAAGSFLIQCQTAQGLEPPRFNYDQLADRYFRTNPAGHFPVTIQRGTNLQPVTSLSGHMFYTSNVLGSGDIWIRDLGKTVNVPLIKHPAEQYKPAITPPGDRLVFVTEDQDPRGDLRIVTINATEVIENTLDGVPPEDLWEDSVDLSAAIAELAAAQNMNARCLGDAAETDPVWNHNGTLLAFATDRCNSGDYDVWMLEMEEATPIALYRLTEGGGVQPRFGPESRELVFISFRDSSGGRIYLGDLRSNRLVPATVRELDLPAAPGANSASPYIYANPILSRRRDSRTNELRPGLTLYYSSIRKDTNRNDRIDGGDRAALYAYDVSTKPENARTHGERQLLDASAPLLGATHSDTIGGVLLYAARLYNSVNVYFLRPRGIIPLEPDIHRQYELRETYAKQNPDRFVLALDAVERYYGDQKEFLAYEGLLAQERLRFYESRGTSSWKLNELRESTRRAEQRNPFAALQIRRAKLRGAERDKAPGLINDFISSIQADRSPYASDAEARVVLAAAYRLLADSYSELGRDDAALASISALNEAFPDYHLRDATMLRQARLELSENLERIKAASDASELKSLPLIPETYSTLLKEIRARACGTAPQNQDEGDALAAEVEQCRSNQARSQELIHSDLFDFYYERRSPAEALELAEFTLGRERNQDPARFDDFLRLTLLTIRARAMYDDKRYLDALNESTAILARVPPGPAGQAVADGWRSIYIRAWQITSYVQEQLGNFSEAYAAKLNYGGAYSRETSVDIDTQDFIDIIEESESFINLYLRTARDISTTVKENESVLLGATISAAIDAVTNSPIDIGGTEMDVLYEFCQPSSRNRILFVSLGPSYDERYVQFCQNNYERLDNRNFAEFPIKSARTAADLLYIASYANASILNIMFLNIKKLGVLSELYRERAVYYQRLKINIAAEKNQRLLESRTRDLLVLDQSDLVALVSESDPYDSQTYDELIFGYRSALKTASDVGDLSLLYGYAYILIKKNTEREAFYENLQREASAARQGLTGLAPGGGASLPQSLLIEKKEEILRDFKHADYLLQYILNVDPLNVDAYLLQGWLYQYIDDRRSEAVQTVPTFIENIYYYITRSNPATLSDGRFYADLYQNYFPENLYESNVELFRQALQKVEGEAPDQATGNLHLNLANNYFKLLNFQRATEHYEKSENYIQRAARKNQSAPFDNYRRHALFHFNMGRALFYEGRLDEAARRLQKAYDIYDESERKPLHERFSTLNYVLATSQNATEDSMQERRIQRQKLKDILEQSEEVRLKMALIAAMIGLAHWEAGRPDEAVLFYQDAILRLYENADGRGNDTGFFGEEATSGGPAVVERASLMNFIALAHQSQRNYGESDARALQAGRYARDRGLTRNDLRYEPQTLGGRALGCILPYGEDFSIIGEGRTPYGFSPLRQYHLSLGVQLENRIQQGDLEGASYLLRQRRQAFQAKDMDVRLGRQGFVATLNQEALNHYRAGEFSEAAEVFREAADRSRDFDFLQSFRQNYYNYFKALFAGVEAAENQSYNLAGSAQSPEDAVEEITDGLEEIENFRENYRDELREQFIAARTAEVPDYEFDEERDGQALQQKLNQQLLDILSIEGTLYFYLGRLRLGQATSRAALDLAYADLNRAVSRYDDALGVFQSANPSGQQALRIRINRARTLRTAGRLQQARSALRGIIEDAYEFNLIREEWLAHGVLAEVYDELHAVYGRPEDREQASVNFAAGAKLLSDNPQVYSRIRRNANPFFESAADFYIRQGQSKRALQLLEQRWENYLSWQFYRNPLEFRQAGFQNDYNLVRQSRSLLLQLDDTESLLRIQRKPFAKITERKRETRERMNAALARMSAARPRLRAFTGALLQSVEKTASAPRLRADQSLLRLFYSAGPQTAVSAWCFRGPAARFTRIPLNTQSIDGAEPQATGSAAITNAVRTLGRSCFRGRAANEQFVISDPLLYNLDVAGMIATATGQDRPAYSTRLTDSFAGFLDRGDPIARSENLNLLNVRTGLVYNSDRVRDQQADVIGLRAWETNALFPAGEKNLFDPRGWIADERHTSLAFVSRPETSESFAGSSSPGTLTGRANYRRDAGIYEVLRATGTGTVAFIGTSADNDEATEALADIDRLAEYGPPGAKDSGDADRKSQEALEAEEELRELRSEQPGRETVHQILKARGTEAYTMYAKRVFGSSGHLRRNFYDVLLQKHVQARQAAEAAEDRGELEIAKTGYALAESYIQSHPQETLLRFENDLGQARIQVRENRNNRGANRTARFDRLLARYSNNAVKLPRIYDTAIETLLVENLPHVARKYLSAYIDRFPDRKAEIIRKNALLSFRARLKSVEYGDGSRENRRFTKDFSRVYRQIVASPDATEFLDDLIKHSQHGAARQLGRELAQRPSTRSEARLAQYENEVDEHLLNVSQPGRPARPRPTAVDFSQAEDDTLEALHLAYQGDWRGYEEHAQSIEEELRRRNKLALAKFRLRLFEQWRLYSSGQPANILDISNVSLEAGANAYTSVSRLERGMIFELLIANIIYDPELQIARMLENLIRVERAVSLNRALRMALSTAESFLRAQDFNSSRRYLQTCVDLADDSIPNPGLRLRLARLGTAMHAADMIPLLRNNGSSWQREESEAARKRRDQQWRERLIKKWHSDLNKADQQRIVDLYTSLPREFAPENFAQLQTTILAGDAQASVRAEVPIALGILRARAIAAEKWKALLDIGFYQQEYGNYQTARRLQAKTATPVYTPVVEKLLKRLPKGQNFVALIDSPERAIRLTYRDRSLQGVRLKPTGRFLRGRMHQYLIRERAGMIVDDLREELSRQYRAMFGLGQSGITYYWLSEVHALAPIAPERGDRLFQVLNPRSMAAASHPPLIGGWEFSEEFRVRAVAAESTDRRPDYRNPTDALFFERLETMERLSLGATTKRSGAPRQLFGLATPQSMPDLGEESADASAWFFTGNRLTLDPATEVDTYNYLLAHLGARLQGPGVVTVRMPTSLDHARFLRQYYSRSIPSRAIYRRFLAAAFNLRREGGGNFQYRLVTSNFLKE